MTTIMNQVTCSSCTLKTDELKWNEHVVSTNHSQLFENKEDKIAIKFFEMIFSTYSKISEIYNLKPGKTHDFWQNILQQSYQKENLIYYAVIQAIIQN